MTSHWYALAVEPDHDLAVAARLHEMGVEMRLLLEEVWDRRGGRRAIAEPRLRPLLTGYLFVRLDLAKPTWCVEDREADGRPVVHGVRCLVRGASPWPAMIADSVLERLWGAMDPDALEGDAHRPYIRVVRAPRVSAKAVTHGLCPGMERRIADGAWTGFIARVLELRGPERLWALIGGRIEGEIPAAILEGVG